MKQLFRGWSWEHWYNLAQEDIEAAFDSVRRAARIALYAGIALWVVSGVHIVRQDEVGVKTVCGWVLRGVEKPGLRYRLPWPLGSVRLIPIQRQQRVFVGMSGAGLTADQRLGKYQEKALDTTVAGQFEKDTETKGSTLETLIKEGQKKNLSEGDRTLLGDGMPLLTADHNVILVAAVIQYIVKEPREYLYASEGAELLLTRATKDALLLEAASTGVDDLLTTARTTVQQAVKRLVNQQLAPYRLGVEVVGIELQRVSAPEAVAPSFRAVNTAREDAIAAENQAKQYAGTVVPEAQGQGDQMVAEAKAYRSTRTAEAHGEASRFNGVLREYQQSGPLTAERLRLETVERALQRAKKVQVGGTPNSPVDVTVMPSAPDAGQ